ncbi:MAG: peptidoglycan D,D-transpeptidase FtsI family protein [Paraclostridium sp.]
MTRKKSDFKYKTKTRLYITFIVVLLIYVSLMYRLVDIQIIQSEKYKERAHQQSNIKLDLSSGRGTIYDRNNKKITDDKVEDIIIVQKQQVKVDMNYMSLIKQVTGLRDDEIYDKLQEEETSPIVDFKVENINSYLEERLEEEDIILDKKTYRYSENSILSHTVGYIRKSDNVAISGIEKSKDDLLKNQNLDYIEVFKAGSSGNNGELSILNGSVNSQKNSDEDRHLKLTVDYDIQSKLEDIVDKEDNPTAVVISDVSTGEILAISSRPNFDRNNIASSTQDNEKNKGEQLNRAIQVCYPPGSVFKIVVLFAALDNNIIDENYTYTCTGSVEIGDRVLNCNNAEGHGTMTLEQAFANSCNPAFTDITLKVGKENIIEASKGLHLNEEVGIDIVEEKSGTIDKTIDEINLSIGQGSMEFTPLQVNQMTQVIANNGLYKQLHIYDSIIDNEKNIVKTFETTKDNDDDIVSPYTITKIKNMMNLVSTGGTAKDLADLDGGSAVKTGTAQAYIQTINADGTKGKEKILHGWVTGFYPAQNPKYTITVFVEGVSGSSKSAVPIFKKICDKILK